MHILNTVICNSQNNEVYPQVISMGLDYNWDGEDSITKITTNTPLTFEPNFNAFHLDPETQITDIVSQSYIYTRGLLLSEAMMKAIEEHLLQPYSAYAAKVVYDQATLDYRWLHITEEIETHINFSESKFSVIGGQSEPMPVQVNDYENLRAQCRRLVDTSGGELLARTLSFSRGTPAYDLFFVQLTKRHIFISDWLANTLMRSSFTGFEVLPSEVSFGFG